MDLRAQADLLIVREGARLPKVCAKCGATQGVSRRDQAFGVGSYGAGAGAGGGVIGVMVANVLRNAFRDEPGVQAAIIAALVVVVAVGAAIAQRVTPKLHLEVPLCGQHLARLEAALQHRTWLLLALAVAGVLLVFGIAVVSMWLLGLALAIVLGAIGVAYVAGMPKAWVTARWAKDGHVALHLAPEVTKKILERAERRAKKSATAETGTAETGGDEASPPA